ncbi:Retrovirus-related Pol polyprotein from type-1 retrotransposable element R1 [Araneus ventricosus]|uniref:Retrovirus-related Pol polyprotein from type-1 retrotransposable element R1 n=1 Tax=Araneus ventricosus TaxID=182803 RepID=A0A4Y2Q9V9_ARAVE|nr:Retrovirus-related Pol polyprotein from type-1 retrotransposable element R1 [Araneus ventricosus]
MGCPQGSCSGPTLWNLVVNEILQETWPENSAIQAFADDFVIVSHASTKIKIENQIHTAIEKFINWANKNKLQISTGKTQYILFSKLRRPPRIRWQGEIIQRKHTIKYLGLLIHDKLNCNAHLRNLSTKSFTLYQNLLKITGKNWGFSLRLRRMLHKTIIEKILAYGAAVWCFDPTFRIKRKLNTIQRPLLLALTGAYRTTATSALQVILVIRLKPPAPARGQSHSHSKTEHLPSGHFDISRSWRGQNIIYRWLAKLQDYNTVFQAELLALKHATDHATSLPHRPITILVDNQASVQAAANPKSINTTAREICKSLITNKHIRISCIKAHVGYDGNEEADRLAKEAAESDRDRLSVKAPISFLKSIFKKKDDGGLAATL